MGDPAIGIVTCGVAYQYAREVFPDASYLKLGMTYPLPRRLVAEFAQTVQRLIVIEELDPCLEEEIKLMGIECEGKSIFPICHELDPKVVRDCAIVGGLLPGRSAQPVDLIRPALPPRPE